MKKAMHFLLILVIASCNNATNREAATEPSATEQSANEPNAAVPNAAVPNAMVPSAAQTASLRKQFDDLEKVFDNQNWMGISGKDTSYLYVSRLNQFLAYAHHYKMRKGDSVEVVIDTIAVNEQQQIRWRWRGGKKQDASKELTLASSTEFTNTWTDGATTIQFKKVDARNLVSEIVSAAGGGSAGGSSAGGSSTGGGSAGASSTGGAKAVGSIVSWKKTIPLSTFLVRSFYDYQHGTKLAFELDK